VVVIIIDRRSNPSCSLSILMGH